MEARGNITAVKEIEKRGSEVRVYIITRRAPSWDDECDGTEWPDSEAWKAAHDYANKTGLRLRDFQDIEKGWGFFRFRIDAREVMEGSELWG